MNDREKYLATIESRMTTMETAVEEITTKAMAHFK